MTGPPEGGQRRGRNDPCPCGSGSKYRLCCGRLAAQDSAGVPGPVEIADLVALLDPPRYRELERRSSEFLVGRPEAGLVWQLLGIAMSKQGKDAVPALAAAVRCLPDDAVANFNLGNAYGRRGQFTEAAASYASALAIQPHFAEAHQHLADVQLELGRSDEAIASSRRALEIRPTAEAHLSLGRALSKAARIDEAIVSLRRALTSRGDFAEAQFLLGNALRSIGQLDEAMPLYRAALVNQPDSVPIRTELATALRLQRHSAESEALCRAALALDPGSVAPLMVLAELRADNGHFAEAEELLRRALTLDPEHAEAWAALTRVRRMTPADGAWLAAAESLAARGLAPQRELSLRFAIGKYFDDIEEYESAFRHYRLANELAKLCGPRHDRTRVTAMIDLIIGAHGREWLDPSVRRVSSAARPVFIVGMLRSGTTLAEQILAAHPSVYGGGELSFWTHQLARMIVAPGDPGDALTPEASRIAALGDAYLELLQGLSPDDARVVDKLPTNFLALGLIFAAFPQARVIHLRRNPLDTCLSIYFQHFEAVNTYANDLGDLAHYYAEYRRLMGHWRTVLPAGALLEVPYEALVREPAQWTRTMLAFIGLSWDPRCLDFHAAGRAVVTASKWQVRQPVHRASVDRWRHYEAFIEPLVPLLRSMDEK